ncbi:four-carbon acid sugar kinase family protein [Glaciibacter superstes]|uniref:four-carbon acid sugar kinase family protein n=1 Tax=Glaciibacter superstes TaxID=501023 RepID=UPI0003B753A9|nr:four-carbon acid sugar kinase family protein [Glaciibacter superstes]
MKTVVLDDDPTGTQSASDVTVLLASDADMITDVLRTENSVYIQTNSRSLDTASAVQLAARIRSDALEAGDRLGEDIRFVLRGDSTLRGHVFTETAVFMDDESVVLFVPAFPDGGRVTRNGIHLVTVAGVEVPAGQTEYASDPVFPFTNSRLSEFVKETSSYRPVEVGIDVVRSGGLENVLLEAHAGSVVLPDAHSNEDIREIAQATDRARARGARIVVRSAAPLAAMLAGVESRALLGTPLVPTPLPTVLVCGSHTTGATAQLAQLVPGWGRINVIDTAEALLATEAAADTTTTLVTSDITEYGLAILATERNRRQSDNTLRHGELVMKSLIAVVESVRSQVGVVIAKGGITSAEVARQSLGARSGRVLGQILPGVSVWRLNAADGREILFIIVPGNVGGPETLSLVLQATGLEQKGNPMSSRDTRALSNSRMMHGGWRNQAALTESERRTFDALVDTLIPPEDGWPASTALGICDLAMRYIVPDEEELSLYPHLRAAELREILDTTLAPLLGDSAEKRTDFLASLEQRDPSLFCLLRDFVYYVYYGHESVVSLISSRSRHGADFHGAPQPLGYDSALETWGDKPLTRTGAFFRTDDVVRIRSTRKETHDVR